MTRRGPALPLSTLLMLLALAIGCGGQAVTRPDADRPSPTTPEPEPTLEPRPQPSSVSVTVDGKLVEGIPPMSCTAPGFSGFQAALDGYSMELEAFVQEPGVYMGDPLRILYLAITPPGSSSAYIANTAQGIGSLTLRVTAIEPRFTGTLSGILLEAGAVDGRPLVIDDFVFDIGSEAAECP